MSECEQPDQDEIFKLLSVVLASTEDFWHEVFAQHGLTYREPKLVIFEDSVQMSTGVWHESGGPIYNDQDETIYFPSAFIDYFMSEVLGKDKLHIEFAAACVVAHEVGHHVQKLIGRFKKSACGRYELPSGWARVPFELEADRFAGAWAHYADKKRRMVEAGDMEAATRFFHYIGDDNLRRQGNISPGFAMVAIDPEQFSHGNSQDRQNSFLAGYKGGAKNLNLFKIGGGAGI
ncbi:MAG: neutral zinc metallopeptidase [Alphaproteobacteria bacterium]|nr:neutral zinc metallopeptidase [Alphaproteobacteria bacterium]